MAQARILVVEDDPAAARLTESLLRAANHQVIGTVATGREALQLADSTQPDLVIMDIMLPGGLDGIQTAEILGQRHDIPVLYLTAHQDEALFERARATSPSAYLNKPFDEQALRRAIEVTLDRHQLLRRLKTSEAHLQEAQALARMGSWRWDMVQDRVEVSDELLRLLNLAPGSFQPRLETFLQLACAEDRARMLRAVESHLHGENPGDVDLRVHDAETPARVLRLRGSVRLDAQGKPIALVGTARDITEEWRARQDAEAYRDRLEAKVLEATAELRATNLRLQAEIEERLRMEAAIRRNEQRYHGLIDNLPEATLVMRDDRVVFANPAAARLFAFPSPNALRDLDLSRLVHADCRQTYESCKQATQAGQADITPTLLAMSRADGSLIEVEVLSFAFDYEGQPAILAVLRDLTDRRAMERETARFRVALDSSPDAVCLVDPETMRFVDVNSTACASLGYDRKELLALGPQDVKPRFNKAMLRQHFAEVLAGRPGAEIVQTEHRRKDGSLYPVEIRLRPFASGGHKLIVAVARDISEREKAQAQLREADERFRQLAENVSEVFWIRDLAENRFLYVSPACEALFGKSVASLYRHPRAFLSAIHAEDQDRVAAAFDRQRLDGQGAELEYRVIDGRGRTRWLWVRTFPIRDGQGQVYRMAGIAQDVTQRRESEERYRSILQTSMDGFLLVDGEGRVVDCNEAYCRMSGYSREEMLALSIPELEAIETPEDALRHNRDIVARGHDRFETRHRRKDGRLLDLEISVYFTPDAEGGRFVSFLRDISARKQAEDALKHSESRYRSLVANLPGIAYRCALDADWTMEIMSSEAERLTGYSASDFIAGVRAYASIIHPEDRAYVRHQVEAAVAKKRAYELEYRLLHADGHTVIVHENGHGVFDDQGRLLWLDGFIWDVTQSKLMEEALRGSEARARAMLLAVPVGFGVLVKRVFHEINVAMTAITGYSRAELLGRCVRMLYDSQEDFERVGTKKDHQIRELGVGAMETRWRRKDGAMIHVALSWAPIVAGDLNQGVILTVQDITTIKQAEQARLQHESRQRDALVREVHHRIKNNLQGVIGLLREQAAQAPHIQAPIEAAIAQINTISVVHGLQSRTPQHEPRLRELLIEVCQAAVALALAPPPPPLQDVLAGDVWLDSGSTVTIALVLNELMQNALKHGDGPGPSNLSVVIYGDVSRAVVRISNPGTALPQAFDFSRGTGLGTGLGLVHTLLPRHGASLTIGCDGVQVNAELVLTPPVISPPPLNDTANAIQEPP